MFLFDSFPGTPHVQRPTLGVGQDFKFLQRISVKVMEHEMAQESS